MSTRAEVFGRNLKAALAELEMSQADLCFASRTSPRNICYYANGHQYPQERTMKKILKVLGVPYSVFALEDPEEFIKAFRERRATK